MRSGLTLIELIFSMLIIAIVFSVIPKIIFASNKSMASSMKEDSLFYAYTQLGSIYKLAWDENTLKKGKILDTNQNTCDDYRIGGFIGSRNCKDSDDNATNIGRDANDGSDYDDIDDYDDYNETDTDRNVTVVENNKYVLYIDVNYVDANYTNDSKSDTNEFKEINVSIKASSDNKKMKGFKSSFFFYSTNLGLIPIKKMSWK